MINHFRTTTHALACALKNPLRCRLDDLARRHVNLVLIGIVVVGILVERRMSVTDFAFLALALTTEWV